MRGFKTTYRNDLAVGFLNEIDGFYDDVGKTFTAEAIIKCDIQPNREHTEIRENVKTNEYGNLVRTSYVIFFPYGNSLDDMILLDSSVELGDKTGALKPGKFCRLNDNIYIVSSVDIWEKGNRAVIQQFPFI